MNDYPNPEGATLKEVAATAPLRRISVILLNRASIEYAMAPLNSQEVCEKKLEERAPTWNVIWSTPQHPALTSKVCKAALIAAQQRCRQCPVQTLWTSLRHALPPSLIECESFNRFFSPIFSMNEGPPGLTKLVYLGFLQDNSPHQGCYAVSCCHIHI